MYYILLVRHCTCRSCSVQQMMQDSSSYMLLLRQFAAQWQRHWNMEAASNSVVRFFVFMSDSFFLQGKSPPAIIALCCNLNWKAACQKLLARTCILMVAPVGLAHQGGCDCSTSGEDDFGKTMNQYSCSPVPQ